MKSLAALFSIGRIADWFARTVGWSPIGRKLVFQDAEGPLASTINGLVGSIVSMTDGTLLVEAPGDRMSDRAENVQLVLTPRHVGWTARSLIWTRIAVVVELLDRNSGTGSATIASVRVHAR